MERVSQRYRLAGVDEITKHPKNPRKGDVDRIGESIEANGFYGAVIVQKSTGYVLAGNHTLDAAIAAGATRIPILEVDVDDVVAFRILHADNATAEAGGYDENLLIANLRELGREAGSIEGSGFNFDEFRKMEKRLERLAASQTAPAHHEGHAEYRCPSCGHEWTGARKPEPIA